MQAGDPVGVFYVVKVAGAVADGVQPGEELCYRCRYGSSPMVLVFVRDTGGQVVDLVRRIDAALAEHASSGLRGLVTLVGGGAAGLKRQAEKLAQTAAVKQVPVVVAKDSLAGPASYKLSGDVDVTIVIARDSQATGVHRFGADGIDVNAVMSDLQAVLSRAQPTP
jgi:hypothetical protein